MQTRLGCGLRHWVKTPSSFLANFTDEPFFRIDSIMLLEEGFEVVSVDASDKMLKYALKARWNRRKEPAFDNWGETQFVYCPLEYFI